MEQPRSSGQAVNYFFCWNDKLSLSRVWKTEDLQKVNQQLSLSLSRVWKTEDWQQCQSTTGISIALSALELIWKLGTLKTHRYYTIMCIKMCHNASWTKISCQGWRWARWWQPWVWRGGHRPVHCRGEVDLDLYIMMKCLSVTKMITSELSIGGAKRDPCYARHCRL